MSTQRKNETREDFLARRKEGYWANPEKRREDARQHYWAEHENALEIAGRSRARQLAKDPDYYRKEAANTPVLHKLIIGARTRAKKHGEECTLTYDNVLKPSHCPVWGYPLDWTTPRGQRIVLDPRNVPSLDRWDNSIPGYPFENTRVISKYANTKKGYMNVEMVRQMLSSMEKGHTNGRSDMTIEMVRQLLAYMEKSYTPTRFDP